MSDLTRHLMALQGTLVTEHTQAPGLFGEIARMEELLADTKLLLAAHWDLEDLVRAAGDRHDQVRPA